MMTDSIMKGEASSSSRGRVESRSPLHRRKSAKSGAEEMADSEQNVNNVNDSDERQGEVFVSRNDAQEVIHLKDLLLVHLDMISQQQDLILAKDRQIRTLKLEKEALKCRLERMERRMSLLKQKGSTPARGDSTAQPRNTELDSAVGVGEAEFDQPTHVRNLNFNNSTPEQILSKSLKRKGSQEPGPVSKKQVVGSVEHDRGDARDVVTGMRGSEAGPSWRDVAPSGISGPEEHAHHSPRRHASASHQHQLLSNKSAFGVRHFTRSPFNPVADTGHDSDTSARTVSPGTGACRRRPRDDDPPERGILDGVKERLQPVCQSLQEEEYFHRTDRMYYVPWEVPLSPLSRISPKKLQAEVRVPSFRVRPIQTGYSMEGTENLDDEIFLKRHQKPELEEKRRKRWDMQRLREQKLYEKLQGKKQTRIAPIQLKPGKAQDVEGPPESFIPELEDVRYIEICDHVPVSAFGYPVPQLDECEFDLPDFDLDQRESDESKRSSTRKKR